MGQGNPARDNAPMGLLNKFLRAEQRNGAPSLPPSASRFQDSGAGPEPDGAAARTAVRRELIQVTLRETMRHHGVPSDWLEVACCRSSRARTRAACTCSWWFARVRAIC